MRGTKRYLQLVVLAALAGLASWVIAHYDTLLPNHWQEFRDKDGNFSVEFPDKTQVEDRPQSNVHLIRAMTKQGDQYGCGYSDVSNPDESAYDLLTKARAQSIQKVGGDLVMETQVKVRGYPGLEFQARTRGNLYLDSRLILVGNRLYVLSVLSGPGEEQNAKNVRRFFDSFRLNVK